MKRTLLLSVSLIIILFQSCKEIGPEIDMDVPGVSEDTTYTATPEIPQAKKVLAEEFTGVSCPPCPNGHALMASIKTELSGKLVIIGYHVFNYPQANPVEKDGVLLSHSDFRTEDATSIGNTIFGGIGGMPLASIDRTKVGNDLLLNTPNWSNAATSKKDIPTPVNIHITSAYDSTTKEAIIKVTLAYTADVDMKQNLTIGITEDSIVDAQKTLTTIIKDYVHEHVLRDIITPINGVQIPDKVNPKVAGKVYERIYKTTIKDEWHAKHCNVVAFVTNDNPDNHSVVHAAEVKLIGN
jgi:hypothetical protein